MQELQKLDDALKADLEMLQSEQASADKIEACKSAVHSKKKDLLEVFKVAV